MGENHGADGGGADIQSETQFPGTVRAFVQLGVIFGIGARIAHQILQFPGEKLIAQPYLIQGNVCFTAKFGQPLVQHFAGSDDAVLPELYVREGYSRTTQQGNQLQLFYHAFIVFPIGIVRAIHTQQSFRFIKPDRFPAQSCQNLYIPDPHTYLQNSFPAL